MRELSKDRIKLLIRGKHRHHYCEEIVEPSVTSHKFTVNDVEYDCKKAEAWKKRPGFIDRRIRRIGREFLIIYQEGDPEPVTKPKDYENSAEMLFRVWRFRGVDEGLEDEFKKDQGQGLPWWAIIIALIALIVVAVYFAIDAGVINLGQAQEPIKGAPKLLWALLMRGGLGS